MWLRPSVRQRARELGDWVMAKLPKMSSPHVAAEVLAMSLALGDGDGALAEPRREWES